ncbi:energy-coupling factor transporter transmembrane component T [Atopobiaceae bacterium 24-176]
MPHPAVRALWAACCLVAAMATFEPVVLSLSLGFAVLSSLVFRGARATGRTVAAAVPLMALVAVVNPLLSQTGQTVLLSCGPVTVRLEALAWGLAMGAMLAGALTWFAACSVVLPADDVRDLLGNVMPTLALAVSMVMRLVPELLGRARASRDAQGACTCAGSGTAASTFGRSVEQAGAMVTWALGESVERASSMASRGWGAGQRTHWCHRRWRTGDWRALASVAAVSVPGVCCALWLGSLWTYVPQMGGLGPAWAYGPVALLFALPCLWAAAQVVTEKGE